MARLKRVGYLRARHVDCPSENLLLDAIEGRLASARRREVRHHVDGCSDCRLLLDTHLSATSTLLDGPVADTPQDPARTAETTQPQGAPLDDTVAERTPRIRPAVPEPESDPLLGSSVGEYRVDEMIGSGGMGIVYRGHHPLIGKPVAIKVLRRELAADADHTRRMLVEARAMNAIAHRSIVDVFAFGELADGRQYMVMEFLAGEPLHLIAREQSPMPMEKLLPLLDGILEALEATHAAGIVHRDLKPSNLFVVKQNDGSRFVKLLDFGLARRERDRSGHTQVGRLVLGTPGYMAPEQIRAAPVSPRTDLYALGVIAYELATGKRPFVGRDALEVMRAQVDQAPRPPTAIAEHVTPELERWILHMMAKVADQRPESATVARRQLKRLHDALPSQQITHPRGTPLREPSRSPWLFAGLGAGSVGVLLVGVAGWALFDSGQPKPSPPVNAARVTVLPLEPEPAPPRPEPLPETPPPEAAPPVEDKPMPVIAPPPPKRATPAPLTQKALLERSAKLRRKLLQQTPKGEEPDRMASMLLSRAETQTRQARGEVELRQIDQTLTDLERKYFKR